MPKRLFIMTNIGANVYICTSSINSTSKSIKAAELQPFTYIALNQYK